LFKNLVREEIKIMTTSLINDQKETINKKNQEVIFSSSGKATAIAALPIPFIDIIAITYIQIDMIEKLAANYGIATDNKTRAILSALFSTLMSSLLTEIAVSIASKTGLKTLFGKSMIKASIHGFTTTLTGELYARHFRNGGTLHNIDVDDVVGFVKQQVKDGDYSMESIGSEIIDTTVDQISS